jgi:hypothetical protein
VSYDSRKRNGKGTRDDAQLVVEVMVTLSDGGESGDEVVSRGVLVVEGGVSEPVGERVNTEGRLKGTGRKKRKMSV